eukprot:CAMPEP_0185019208 /NCGR_PEP_ID=MMETSP1103-20130426/1847_1 /TAXON_ID=36769 /ORGANISM="Paraphysomonas bandaiensis, Strain Caron Lab Isolate" /LENGTH=93 /DNA_ID=CAMNT_0027549405 /DNA_START=373 /DNA_END=654 /DNA_ORIENTATION=-
MHPIVERHLGDSAAIIHNAAFEKAVVKIQCGNEAVTRTAKDQTKIHMFDEEEEDYDGASLAPNDDAAQRCLMVAGSGSEQDLTSKLVTDETLA